jgi:hypothetical protein
MADYLTGYDISIGKLMFDSNYLVSDRVSGQGPKHGGYLCFSLFSLHPDSLPYPLILSLMCTAPFIPGVIEVLVNSGKQIDAVNLAFAFELTEQFSPVSLLKSYLIEARRSSPQGRPGNASPAVQASVP